MTITLRAYLNNNINSLSEYEVVGLWFLAAFNIAFFQGCKQVNLDLDTLLIDEDLCLWGCGFITPSQPSIDNAIYALSNFFDACLIALKSAPIYNSLEKIAKDICYDHCRDQVDIFLITHLLGLQFLALKKTRPETWSSRSPYIFSFPPNAYELPILTLYVIDNAQHVFYDSLTFILKRYAAQDIRFSFLLKLIENKTTFMSQDHRWRYTPHLVAPSAEDSDIEESDEDSCKAISHKRVTHNHTKTGTSKVACKIGEFSDGASSRFVKLVHGQVKQAQNEIDYYRLYSGQSASLISLTFYSHLLIFPFVRGQLWASYLEACEKQNAQLFIDPTFWRKIFNNLRKNLMQLQSKNLVHRDLHEGNVLVNDNEELIFVDFGRACFHQTQIELSKVPNSAGRYCRRENYFLPPWGMFNYMDFSSEENYFADFADDVFALYFLFRVRNLGKYSVPFLYLLETHCPFPENIEECHLDLLSAQFELVLKDLLILKNLILSIETGSTNVQRFLNSSSDRIINRALILFLLTHYLNMDDFSNGLTLLNVIPFIELSLAKEFYQKFFPALVDKSNHLEIKFYLEKENNSAVNSFIKLETLKRVLNAFSFFAFQASYDHQNLFKLLFPLANFFEDNSSGYYLSTAQEIAKNYLDLFCSLLQTDLENLRLTIQRFLNSNTKKFSPSVLNLFIFFYQQKPAQANELFSFLFSFDALASFIREQLCFSEIRKSFSLNLPGCESYQTLLRFLITKIDYYFAMKKNSATEKALCLILAVQFAFTEMVTTNNMSSELIDLVCMILGHKRGFISSGIADGLLELYDYDLKNPHFTTLKSTKAAVPRCAFFANYQELTLKVNQLAPHKPQTGCDLYGNWQKSIAKP